MSSANTNNYKTWTWLSILLIFLGFTLLVYMILVEDEPGAIPLAMIIGGVTALSVIHKKKNS